MRKFLGVLFFAGLIGYSFYWARSYWVKKKASAPKPIAAKTLSATTRVKKAESAEAKTPDASAIDQVKRLTMQPVESRKTAKSETKKPTDAVKKTRTATPAKLLATPKDGEPAALALAVIQANADWKTIRKIAANFLDQRKYEDAARFMTKILLDDKNPDIQAKAKNWLDDLNENIILTPTPTSESVFYTVKPGDSLWKIARKYKTTVGLIKLVNRKSSSRIRPGERLKIPKGDITIVVDKSDYKLTLLLDGMYIAQYPVGVGRYNKTPEGTFEVGSMRKHPIWYAPDGKVYAYGHPKNILGTRWIGLKETPEFSGYGIHGTTHPETIGKAMSNGCIRMRNEDVEKVFDLVRVGTKVIIRK